MQETNVPDSLAVEFLRDAGAGVPEVTNRDMASQVLQELDYESQLSAISDLLRRNDDADAGLTSEINETESFAKRTGNERAVGEWVDLVHASTYQSAAHSMAAVGMIAPLIESLFYQGFQGIRTQYYVAASVPIGHARSALPPDTFWNCHRMSVKGRDNLVRGILDLAKAIELSPYLPRDSERLLKAVIAYRNKMFHCGFEWPKEDCKEFAKCVAKGGWESWFASAKRKNEPWIFFMTEAFINDCFSFVHQLLDAFGAYCRGRNPRA